MDITSFSNDNFSATNWLNNSIKEKQDDESLETYLASMAMRLHLLSQDYSDQLETGMVEAMGTMPRSLSEINRLEDQLKSVQDEMTSLSEQLALFDQKNVAGVEDLSRLDTLKTNMEKCKATLEEHARWSQVVREAKNFLEGGGRLSDSADRIATMYKSLQVLQKMPGHEEREETYQSLSHTLLGALKPRVRRDLAALDLSPLHEYIYVYDKMGRRKELEDEYIQARPDRLKDLWSSYDESSPESFPAWLAAYLGKISGFLSDESSNIESLFGKDKAPEMMSSMLQQIFGPNPESMCQRLRDIGSPEGSTEAYLVTDEFSRRILLSFEGIKDNNLANALLSIYRGFIIYLDNYGDEEGKFLEKQILQSIDEINFDGVASALEDDEKFISPDPADILSAYGERLVNVADIIAKPTIASLRRSVHLMGGLRVKHAMKSIATTLALFTKQLIKKVDDLRIACGFPNSNDDGIAKSDEDHKAPSQIVESWARKLEMYEMGDRSLVPSTLRALQAAGRLSRRLDEINEAAQELLIELSSLLFRDQSIDKIISTCVKSSTSVGAGFASYVLTNDPNTTSEMRRFIASSSSHSNIAQNIFSSINVPLLRLKSSAGSLLFDLCTSIPDKVIADLASEDVWASVDTTKNAIDESLLPQPSITQVGEHMLSLVQELETFASTDALPDLLVLSDEAYSIAAASRGWMKLKQILNLKENDGIEQICKRSNCIAAISSAEKSFGSSSSILPEDFADNVEGGDDEAVVRFVNEWLGAIADAIIGSVLVQLCQITVLSSTGCAQLLTDIGYIENVVTAMGLKHHPILNHIKFLLKRDPSTLAACMDMMPTRNAGGIALKSIDIRICNAIVVGQGLPSIK